MNKIKTYKDYVFTEPNIEVPTEKPSYSITNKNAKINITGTGELHTSYSVAFPSNFDVFDGINVKLQEVDDEEVSQNTEQFINKFNSELQRINSYYDFQNALPRFSLLHDDDGSVCLEWPFPDYRIGFVIDKNIDESSWFLVANKKMEELWTSGQLNIEKPEMPIRKILKYVLENS